MPVQRSLDQIAKSIKRVESSLENIAGKIEENEEIKGEPANMDNSNEYEQ